MKAPLLAVALLLIGASWPGSPRIDYMPDPNGAYRVGVRYDGPIPADTCGVYQIGSSGPFIVWPGVIGDAYYVEVMSPPIEGMPDMLLWARCENEKGLGEPSEHVGCLDSAQDCVRQCGDVRFDYKLSIADFVKIRRAVAAGENPPYCDVTGDKLCTLADFTRLRRWVAGDRTITLEQDCDGRQP